MAGYQSGPIGNEIHGAIQIHPDLVEQRATRRQGGQMGIFIIIFQSIGDKLIFERAKWGLGQNKQLINLGNDTHYISF